MNYLLVLTYTYKSVKFPIDYLEQDVRAFNVLIALCVLPILNFFISRIHIRCQAGTSITPIFYHRFLFL